MMKFLCALAALSRLAGPAFAAGKCSDAPKAQWQPQSALEAKLKADGYTIKQVKVEKGCYEVYATDKAGKRTNMAFNAETLARPTTPKPARTDRARPRWNLDDPVWDPFVRASIGRWR